MEPTTSPQKIEQPEPREPAPPRPPKGKIDRTEPMNLTRTYGTEPMEPNPNLWNLTSAKDDRTEPMEPNPPPRENQSEPNLRNLTSPLPRKNLTKPNLWNLTRTYRT